MEQKIDLEIRLRELAAQSLLEARTEIDVLEVEKSLLTSDQRMNCYAAQLEQQRKRLSNPSLSTDSGRASKTSQRGRRDNSLGHARHPVAATTDVIGAPGATATVGRDQHSSTATFSTGSPSFSSQSSPSKLSPVSGESANSLDGRPPGSATVALGDTHTLSRRRNGALSNKSSLNQLANDPLAQRRARQRERLKQTITSQSNINCNMVQDNTASLSMSELRVPLMWRDVDHFKGRGDYRRYAVFCLLKLGAQIHDTQLISDVDRQHTDLTFEDVIVFNNVEHEFELTLELYSCAYLEQFSLASTPRKLKEKLSNSVSRAMGRRLATQTASVNFTRELEAYDKSYRFALIASAKLALADAADSTKTYDLHLVSPEAHGRHSTSNQFSKPEQAAGGLFSAAHLSTAGRLQQQSAHFHAAQHSALVTASNQKDVHKNTLPLFGHFCCRLHVKPDVFDKCVKSGYLRVATISLPDSLVAKAANDNDDDKQSPRRRVRGRADSPANHDDSGKSSGSFEGATANAELNKSSGRPPGEYDTSSMLRSALAASSKLATISMSTATVHWALLRNFTLHLWQVDEQKLQLALRRGHAPQVDISCKQPFCISIDKFTRLLRVSNTSLTLETDKGCFVIAVHNLDTTNEQLQHNHQDEIGHWLRPIEQMIYDSHIWSSALHHYPPASLRSQRHQKL